MLKSIFASIRKRPVLWLVGLVLPALASFAVNFGFSLSLNAYTAELTGGDAAFRSILLLMAATSVSLVFAVIVEDAARHIFFAFTVKTQNDVKQAMYESIVRTKYAALGGTDRGALYTLYTRDTATAASIPAGDLFGILFPLVHAVGYFIALFAVHALIGAIVSALTAAIIALNLVFVNRFRALEEASLEKREAFARSVDTAVRGRITVRQLQLGHTVSARMAAAAGDVCEAGRRVVCLQLCRKLTLELLTTICTSLVTPVACILAAYGKIELASTVMIAQICRFIVLQTNGLGTAVQQLGVHLVSYRRLRPLLALPDEYDVPSASDAPSPDGRAPAVAFRGFGVAYDGSAVLSGAEGEIRRGEITAVLGPSGSGKTSLVNALLGLTDYTGELRVFGAEVRTVRPDALRRLIAYSPEHGQLFGEDSLLENLLCAAPGRTEEDVRRVCDALALHGVELTRPADALSGGQRMRVSLARALLRDAEILVLDEPTAALDGETEAVVLRLLAKLKAQGKTVLLITHRGTTMTAADRFLLAADRKLHAFDDCAAAVEALRRIEHGADTPAAE